MSNLEIRKCGSVWTYCDGHCSACESSELGYSSGTQVQKAREDCGYLNDSLRDGILAGRATVCLSIGNHVCSFPITCVRQMEPHPYE